MPYAISSLEFISNIICTLYMNIFKPRLREYLKSIQQCRIPGTWRSYNVGHMNLVLFVKSVRKFMPSDVFESSLRFKVYFIQYFISERSKALDLCSELL